MTTSMTMKTSNLPPAAALAFALALALAPAATRAAGFVYEGRLDDLGQPANGRYDLRLTAFADAVYGATLAAPIVFEDVPVVDGRFRIDFELPLASASPAWIEVGVRDGAAAGAFSTIPGRSEAASATLIGACWSSTGDSATNPALNFIGTTDAQPFVVRTQNARSLRIEPSAALFAGSPITTNTIAGSSANSVDTGVRGATIAGGGVPAGDSDPDSSNEAPNRITDHYGVVGGGYANLAGDTAGTLADNAFATVGGGRLNSAISQESTVGGGFGNTASGERSTVGGGSANTASGGRSTLGGGSSNDASGFASTVGGGSSNCAGGDWSWAGGRFAKIRPGIDLGDGTCVANSGDFDGDNGTFVWADDQSGSFISTGPRQFLVRAQGGMAINTNTPSAGAALTVNGSVAIADTGAMSFGSTGRQMLNLFGPNDYGIGVQTSRMYFRSNSGFSWFEDGVHSNTTDDPGAGGTMNMRLSNTGQLQTVTGTISALSDARLKDQIHDYTQALDRINALRPVTYHYKAAGKAPFQPEGTHIGFVAQEMQQVFPEWVSQGDDGYLMLSMRGFEAVTVRAMQELSAENDSLQAENAQLKAADQELRKRLERIETRLRELDN